MRKTAVRHILIVVCLSLLPPCLLKGARHPQFGFYGFPPDSLMFPQFVVGKAGDFSFDVELRIANAGNARFQGVLEIFDDRESTPFEGPRALPPPVLVNGEPYPFGPEIQEPGVVFLLEPDESISLIITPAGEAQPSVQPLGDEQGCLDCFACLLCTDNCEKGEGMAGDTGNRIDDLAVSLFYNVRDGEGNLVDKVNVPPARGGQRMHLVMGRGEGFDTGVAIVVGDPRQIGVAVYLPASGPTPTGSPNVLSRIFELDSYRQDFFLAEILAELPDDVPAALVEFFDPFGLPFWGVALGVQVENATLQISGQNARVSEIQF